MRATAILLTRVVPAVWPLLLAGCADDPPATDAARGATESSAAAGAGENAEMAALEPEIVELERRAQTLRDIAEIEKLQRTYGYYLDKADWDSILSLLTEDATAEYGTSGVYVGKESIRGFLYALGGGRSGLELGVLNEHKQLQPVIDVAPDGATAKARWRVLGLLGRYQEYAQWQDGPYENEYRKEDGKWKISKIHWAERFTVPFEGGLTTSLAPSEDAPVLPPPDRPPTFECEPWPSVSLLPYHFPNPVSGRCAGGSSC